MDCRSLRLWFVVAALLCLCPHTSHCSQWKKDAQATLRETLSRVQNTGVAKNIILIVGDGMSLATTAAARVLKGQKAGRSGIGEQMVYERFPNVGLARTYATDKYVADSASAATAMLCGGKTIYEGVAVNDGVKRSDCASMIGKELRCIGEWALAERKSVGFVTNMRVTHATISPLYAHAPDRWWEYDSNMPTKDKVLCKDIARQLIEDYPGRNFQVILGGGREAFMPNTTFDSEYPERRGKRSDRKLLIDYWINNKRYNKLRHSYVWDKKGFDKVDASKVEFLLGLFEPGNMYDVTDRGRTELSDFDEPSLAEMTHKAIQVLSNNPDGYFLVVESGLIDKRHHSGRAVRAISEALDMEEAINVALNSTSENDTLVLVTSDHSQGLIFTGYASVGEDIFGIAEVSNVDGMPYTTLLYSTGPGYTFDPKTGRKNITGINTAHKDYLQQAAVPKSTVNHGGEDVAVYATGPMSHIFTGVYDQHYIAHAMAYAACIGSNREHCESELRVSASSQVHPVKVLVIFWCLLIVSTSLLR